MPRHRTMISRICRACGQEFFVEPTALRHAPCDYCSRACLYSPVDRFWDKVQKSDGCWIWTGYIAAKTGYGSFGVRHKSTLAHRFSYELHYGAIPAGLFVCHHCDVRSCVRPDHLFLGTCQDNVRDMIQKGRGVTGEKTGWHVHHKAKTGIYLTWDKVREIRTRYARGDGTKTTLAKEFHVSRRTILNILLNQAWKESQ